MKNFFESASFVAVIGLIGVIAGALINAHYNFLGKDQELKIKLIEIGIGILRADPKEDVAPALGWAIKIIGNNSGVPFTGEKAAALMHKPIRSFGLGSFGSGYGEYPANPFIGDAPKFGDAPKYRPSNPPPSAPQ